MEEKSIKKSLRLLVAVNNNFHIGKEGGMLWRCSADLKHFKAMTLNCKCLVGRVTKDGLPPLKDRELIVVGTGHYSLEDALAQEPDWIIGGAQIYRQCIDLCDEIHISHINDNSIGDTKFEIPENYKGKIFHYFFEPNPA